MSRKHLKLGAVVTAVVAALFMAAPSSHAEEAGDPPLKDREARNTAATAEQLYRPVTPCRIVDTRHGGGGAITDGQTRTYSARSGLIAQGASLADCGVPDGARGITANVTITQTTGSGNLRVFPANAGVPNASTINWSGSNVTVANEVGIGLNSSEQFKVFGDIGGGGHTHVIFDVTGFYVEQISGVAVTTGTVVSKSNRVISIVPTGTASLDVTFDTNINGCGFSGADAQDLGRYVSGTQLDNDTIRFTRYRDDGVPFAGTLAFHVTC